MRIVPIEYANGCVLAEDLYDKNGRMLMKLGAGLTDKNIEKIKATQVYSVYIHDKYSTSVITPAVDSHLKNKTMVEMKNLFEAIRKTQLPGGGDYKTIDKHFNKLFEYADDIMYELPKRKHHYIDYVDIKSTDSYTYAHSLNVAVISYLLAQEAKISQLRLKDLFIGALFQDIGMSFINEKLFMKKGKLDVQEFIKIKEHPQLGYNFIKDLSFTNAYIKVIVYQHHEKNDGSGYPNGLKEDEINPLAKLVSIADVYDAMTSDRIYARATTPADALEYIMGAAGRHFDFGMTQKFIKNVIPYPKGSLVKMNTGHIALVEDINYELPLRPFIRLINQSNKDLERGMIDLRDEKNLVISSLQFELP